MTMTKLVFVCALALGSALAAPVSALACGGGPATEAQLRYLRSVEERPAQTHATAATTTPANGDHARHHAAGRRRASLTSPRSAR